jgi:hypothetical protein
MQSYSLRPSDPHLRKTYRNHESKGSFLFKEMMAHSIPQEWNTKSVTSQELSVVQIPWATTRADHSRAVVELEAVYNKAMQLTKWTKCV